MKKIYLFLVQTLVVFSLVFAVSCSKNDDGGLSDPEGTIYSSMKAWDGVSRTDLNWTTPFGTYKATIGNNINFICYQMSGGYGSEGETFQIATIPNVKGLSAITKVPASGWATQAAVKAGFGYVFRMQKSSSGDYEYVRLFVVELTKNTDGGIFGADVKYQYPWQP